MSVNTCVALIPFSHSLEALSCLSLATRLRALLGGSLVIQESAPVLMEEIICFSVLASEHKGSLKVKQDQLSCVWKK